MIKILQDGFVIEVKCNINPIEQVNYLKLAILDLLEQAMMSGENDCMSFYPLHNIMSFLKEMEYETEDIKKAFKPDTDEIKEQKSDIQTYEKLIAEANKIAEDRERQNRVQLIIIEKLEDEIEALKKS